MNTETKTQNLEIHQNSVSFKFRDSRKSYGAKGRIIWSKAPTKNVLKEDSYWMKIIVSGEAI